METHLEEMLREGMRRQTASVTLPDDTVRRATGRYQHRRAAVRGFAAGGAAMATVALAVGLVFGVVLPRTFDHQSVPSVAVTTGAPQVAATATVPTSSGTSTRTSASSPAALDSIVPVALAAMTPFEGEVLHIKTTDTLSSEFYVTDGKPVLSELWSRNDSSWGYRVWTDLGGQEPQEWSYDFGGHRVEYDGETNSILEVKDKKVDGKLRGNATGWEKIIRQMLNSGRAVEDGHEQVDGHDAVRIVQKPAQDEGVQADNVYLVDAETGAPLEFRMTAQGDTIHFDVYEKLQGSPENYALLDIKAAHPTATIYTDGRKFDEVVEHRGAF